MSELDLLASSLDASGRSLRRAANRGTIRVRRPSPNKAEVSASERRYLGEHWPLLRALLAALRTQHNVRLAVLFGSVARGDGHRASDLDLLVTLADDHVGRLAELRSRLADVLDRPVHAISVRDAKAVPMLLADALREGRVLVDRDKQWRQLKSAEGRVQREAERCEEILNRRAWQTLESFRGDE